MCISIFLIFKIKIQSDIFQIKLPMQVMFVLPFQFDVDQALFAILAPKAFFFFCLALYSFSDVVLFSSSCVCPI